MHDIDELLSQLTEQPKVIASLTAHVPRARLHRAISGDEWSLNDVLAHLRSCSDMWGDYMRVIATQDHPSFKAMNPTTWIDHTNYRELEFVRSFTAYARQRATLLSFLRKLPPAAWSRTALVSGAGAPRERTLLEYAKRLADHERTHVRHIARVVEGRRSVRRSSTLLR